MSESLKEKLLKEIGPVDWATLRAHNDRQALFLVGPGLDIADVGVALAEDDTESVKSWLESELLRKPDAEDVARWDQSPNDELGDVLIIQPYVLLKISSERMN